MIDYTEIPNNKAELWELFARDFLKLKGYYIESTPDRGSDQGKDLIVSEKTNITESDKKIKWLVSCKHFANSERAVGISDEKDINGRLDEQGVERFIGFYSTISSSSLNNRLKTLKENEKIKDFKIFDGKSIEHQLINAGYSKLMLRYFPESYKKIKPIHLITNQYHPLYCDACGKDILKLLYYKSDIANFYQFSKIIDSDKDKIEKVGIACKGQCSHYIQTDLIAKGMFRSNYETVSDLLNPAYYLKFYFEIMYRLRNGEDEYSDEAWKNQMNILLSISQRTLRFMTNEDKKRFNLLNSL